MAALYDVRELYGGAMTVELPSELIDARYVWFPPCPSGSSRRGRWRIRLQDDTWGVAYDLDTAMCKTDHNLIGPWG